MTDERIDLSALELGVSDARREAVIEAVHARIRIMARLLGARRRLVVGVAALAGLAAVTVWLIPRETTPLAAESVSAWVAQSRVPSNAELLAAFQGYAP